MRAFGSVRTVRVAVVCPIPFGDQGVYGGGTRYPQELARALREHVHCDLIAFGASAEDFGDPWGLRHVVVRDRSRKHRNHDPISTRLAEVTAGYDVVHFHTVNKLAMAGALLGRRRGQTTLLTPLGGAGLTGIGRLRLHRLFHGFPVISRFTLTAMPWIAGRPHAVVYGGGDATEFRQAAGSLPERRRSRVVYVGRLVPHKGVDLLIRALPAEAELVICGEVSDQDYAAHIRDLARGRPVEFLTTGSDQEVSELYASAVAVVLPSVFVDYRGGHHPHPELLGLVLLEAMWHRTPVVASRVGSTQEIVRDGVEGLLVEPGDKAALEKALVRVLEDHGLAQDLGAAGRRAVEERYTWQGVAARVLSFYQEVAANADR